MKKNTLKTYSFTQTCGGTLISRQSILTSAHCVPVSLTTYYQNTPFRVKIKPNSYFQTYGSMFKVYLGLQNLDKLSKAQKYNVSKLIIVNKLILFVFNIRYLFIFERNLNYIFNYLLASCFSFILKSQRYSYNKTKHSRCA